MLVTWIIFLIKFICCVSVLHHSNSIQFSLHFARQHHLYHHSQIFAAEMTCCFSALRIIAFETMLRIHRLRTKSFSLFLYRSLNMTWSSYRFFQPCEDKFWLATLRQWRQYNILINNKNPPRDSRGFKSPCSSSIIAFQTSFLCNYLYFVSLFVKRRHAAWDIHAMFVIRMSDLKGNSIKL